MRMCCNVMVNVAEESACLLWEEKCLLKLPYAKQLWKSSFRGQYEEFRARREQKSLETLSIDRNLPDYVVVASRSFRKMKLHFFLMRSYHVSALPLTYAPMLCV